MSDIDTETEVMPAVSPAVIPAEPETDAPETDAPEEAPVEQPEGAA